MLELGDEIVIELPNQDRYTISRSGQGFMLVHRDMTICYYHPGVPLSKEVFRTALNEIFSQVKSLLEVE